MYFPKPRGRPPSNSWWDTSCGQWVKHGAPVQPRVVLATPVATAHRADTDKVREKRLQEQKELAEKNLAEMKELSRKYEEEQRAAKAAEEKAACTNACLRRRVVTRNGLRSRFHPTSLCTTWIVLASNSRLASNREFLSGLAPTCPMPISHAEARRSLCSALCTGRRPSTT